MTHGFEIARTYGNRDISILMDGIWTVTKDTLLHLGGEGRRAEVLDRICNPTFTAPVNCFLVSAEGGMLLIDAGVGTEWGPGFGRARELLAKAGVTPADISSVLLTHIHLDHVCGLFNGETAYFPNATIFAPALDLSFFSDPQARNATPESKRGGFEITERLLRIYGDRVCAIEPGPVMSGIELIPLPGHTPGHSGFLLGDATAKVLSVGDAFHHAALQVVDPDIAIPYDLVPKEAARSRRYAIATAFDNGWDICGGHLEGLQRVTRSGGVYGLEPLSVPRT